MFGQQFTQHLPGQIVHQQRFVETFIDRFSGENKRYIVILNGTLGKENVLVGRLFARVITIRGLF